MSESHLAAFQIRLATVPDGVLEPPNVDARAAALAALMVSDLIGREPLKGRTDRLATVGEFDAASVVDLSLAARTILHLLPKLEGRDNDPGVREALADPTAEGAALVQTMVGIADEALDIAEGHAITVYARLGEDGVEIAQNLRVLANYYRDFGDTLTASGVVFDRNDEARARAIADRIERAYHDRASNAQKASRRQLLRAWQHLFVPAYEDVTRVGRFLSRSDRPHFKFPSLIAVGIANRRLRRPSVVDPMPAVVVPDFAPRERAREDSEIFEVRVDELVVEADSEPMVVTADEMVVNADEIVVNADEMVVNADEIVVNADEMVVTADDVELEANSASEVVATAKPADALPVAAAVGDCTSAPTAKQGSVTTNRGPTKGPSVATPAAPFVPAAKGGGLSPKVGAGPVRGVPSAPNVERAAAAPKPGPAAVTKSNPEPASAVTKAAPAAPAPIAKGGPAAPKAAPVAAPSTAKGAPAAPASPAAAAKTSPEAAAGPKAAPTVGKPSPEAAAGPKAAPTVGKPSPEGAPAAPVSKAFGPAPVAVPGVRAAALQASGPAEPQAAARPAAASAVKGGPVPAAAKPAPTPSKAGPAAAASVAKPVSDDARRAVQRFPVKFKMGITATEFTMGVAENLSERGAFVATPLARPPGTRMSLTFFDAQSEEVLHMTAVVRWTRTPKSIPAGELGVGVEFVDMTDDQRRALSRILGN